MEGMLGKARAGRKPVQMLSDISRKTYKAMKREAGTGTSGRRGCHKPAIWHKADRKKQLENGWRHSVVVSGIGLINEVNQHWAWLVLGWVTVCGWVNHLSM